MAALLPCAPSRSTTASFCFRRPSLWPLQDLPSLRPPPSFPAPPLRFATARRTPLLAASSNRSQATQQQQEEEEEEESNRLHHLSFSCHSFPHQFLSLLAAWLLSCVPFVSFKKLVQLERPTQLYYSGYGGIAGYIKLWCKIHQQISNAGACLSVHQYLTCDWMSSYFPFFLCFSRSARMSNAIYLSLWQIP